MINIRFTFDDYLMNVIRILIFIQIFSILLLLTFRNEDN